MSDKYDEINEALKPYLRYIGNEMFPGRKPQGQWIRTGGWDNSDGDKLAFNIGTGTWKFWGTNEWGDTIGAYAQVNAITNSEAAQRLSDKYLRGDFKPHAIVDQSTDERDYALPPHNDPPDWGPNVTWYPYRNPEGRLIYGAIRVTQEDGKKKYRPMYYDGKLGRYRGGKYPTQILYNLPAVTSNPDYPVLIVGGEKCVDAIEQERYNARFVATTWSMGEANWRQCDLSPLNGRRVLLWPDNDNVGETQFAMLAQHLAKAHDCNVKLIKIPGDTKPKKWDVADAIMDEGWKWPEVKQYIIQNIVIAQQINIAVNVSDKTVAKPTPGNITSWSEIGLKLTERGQPVLNQMAGVKIINATERFRDGIWFDEFKNRYMFDGRPRDNNAEIRLVAYAQETLDLDAFNHNHAAKAIDCYADRNRRNEALDFMRTEEWDGVQRIDDSFRNIFKADDTPYVRAVSKNFWVSMVARVCDPGCWADAMIVLEGGQGKGKSKALQLIGGDWWTVAKGSAGGKDLLMELAGVFLVEISELANFRKADIRVLKELLSTSVDKFRWSYAKNPGEYQRQCIFVGTTNDTNYLRDHTGARRFWPVETRGADWDYIRKWRGQLFAEALQRYDSGESWHEVPDEDARQKQDSRYQRDPWEDAIIQYVKRFPKVTVRSVLEGCINLELSKMGEREALRCRGILSRIGWEFDTRKGEEPGWVRKASQSENLF